MNHDPTAVFLYITLLHTMQH